MLLMEEICFLQWVILWVAERHILQMLLRAFHVFMWLFSFLFLTLKKGCNKGIYSETLLLGY